MRTIGRSEITSSWPGWRQGSGIAQARTALAALADRLGRDFPATNAGMVLTALSQSEGRFPTVRSNVFGFSMLTVAIALLMTLIAGANVAGVLLARSASRRAEVGVRLALGASRRRIVAQLLTESASMSLLAGGLGILAAWQATALLSGFEIAIARGATAGVDVTLDYRVLAISVLLTMVDGTAVRADAGARIVEDRSGRRAAQRRPDGAGGAIALAPAAAGSAGRRVDDAAGRGRPVL